MEYSLSGGALTDALAFAPKSPATASRSYRTTINPIGGASGNQPGNILKFDIPVGKVGTFIDTSETLLQFSVQNSGNLPIILDGSAYCFFSRLDVLSMGQVLESIQAYNVLCNTLFDLQSSGTMGVTSGNINLGMETSTTQNFNKAGVTIPAGQSRDFCIPVALSGVIGAGLQKYLPIGKVTDLRAEFTLEDAVRAVVCSGTANFTINNPVLSITTVDIDPVMAKSIDDAVGGRYVLSSESWRNYTTVLGSDGSARSSDSILIPARYSSARTFVSTWRDTANQSNQAKWWLSARSNPFSSTLGATCSIQYQAGSTLLPQQPIRYGVSETWAVGQEAFHQVCSISNPSRCNYANWGQQNYYDTDTFSMGTFALAMNLDSFQNKSASMTCGLNTIQQPTFLNVNYATAPTVQQRVDTWAHFDMVLEVNENGLSARY